MPVWVCSRPSGTPFENRYRLWYYFAVLGGDVGRTVRLQLSNLNEIAKVYNHDLRPLVRLYSESTWERCVRSITTVVLEVCLAHHPTTSPRHG